MRLTEIGRSLVIASGLLGALALSTQGTVILDANYQPELTHTAAITTPPPSFYSNEDHAQTFVVRNSGVITSVEVRVGRGTTPGGPLLFDLRSTKLDGSPSDDGPGAVLAIGSAPLDVVTGTWPDYGWVRFDSLDVPVSAGDRLAIVLQTDEGGYYGWGCRVGGTYTDGMLYRRATGASLPTGGLWAANAGYDAAFRVWVDAGIPEPATFGLLGLGSVGFMSHRRTPR